LKPVSKKRANPTFISLFSGCGGMDAGFSAAGFRPVAAYDIDAAAAASYRHNFRTPCHEVDLQNWKELLPSLDEADVIVAGPPCQGFSLAGPRRQNDPRNSLLSIPARLAAHLPVRALVIENVPGALAEPHRRYWRETERLLHQAGFGTRTIIVDAQSVGLPQTRKRVFLLALRGRTPEGIDELHLNASVPLREVLPVPSSAHNHFPELLPLESREYKIAVRIAQGQKLSNVRASGAAIHTWDIPEVFGAVTSPERAVLEFVLRRRRQARRRDRGDADPVRVSDLREQFGEAGVLLVTALVAKRYLRRQGRSFVDLTQTFNGKYRRLDLNRPTHCVLTRFCDPTYFLHPTEHRPLTVREAARIQGFSDSFLFHGSPSAQARQVGNAVPPALARVVAQSLRLQLMTAS
jgi:DNA (cytosine-5)-methyltransferase 1